MQFIPSGGDADTAGRTGTVLRPQIGAGQVSHDMEGIFRGAEPLPERKADVSAQAIRPIISRSSKKRFRNGWMVALSGVLVAGAVGASVELAQRDIFRIASRHIAAPLPQIASRLESGQRVSVPALAETVPIRIAQTDMASEPAALSAVAAKTNAKASTDITTQKHRSAQRAAEPAQRAGPSRSDSCDRKGGLDLARCMRPQILDADRELRTAYNDAVRAGVERRELVSYRRQWLKLRKRANSDPRSVSAGYREMAQQLEATRVGGGGGDI